MDIFLQDKVTRQYYAGMSKYENAVELCGDYQAAEKFGSIGIAMGWAGKLKRKWNFEFMPILWKPDQGLIPLPLGRAYGKELIMDIHQCDPSLFNRKEFKLYFERLCEEIEMERAVLHFWDDVGVPEDEKQTEMHLKGTSAVQFITTSSVVIHALDLMNAMYVNVFSCKEFDAGFVEQFTREWFKASFSHSTVIVRY